ncbi:SRPBCC family protein [Litorivivens sp.]|uniref:SRPBCC family protein n=1 Tax=Litorivivens sp. TaxID=2020868 RepID=UPI003568DD25
MPITIRYSHEIEASAAQVWEVLTDLEAYPRWNTFVETCRSTLKVGDPIDMRVRVLPFVAQAQREYIFEHEPGVLLSYGIKPAPLGAMKSYRSHRIEALADGRTRYLSSFELSGWFAPVVGLLLGHFLRDGFRRMSQGIADEAERRASSNA